VAPAHGPRVVGDDDVARGRRPEHRRLAGKREALRSPAADVNFQNVTGQRACRGPAYRQLGATPRTPDVPYVDADGPLENGPALGALHLGLYPPHSRGAVEKLPASI